MTAKLLKNGTVLSWDDATNLIKVLPKSSILIQDDRITAIYEDGEKQDVPKDTEIVDVEGKIVSPGFINTHVHAWQTAYRTLGPDIFVVQYFLWLSQMSPATQAFTPDDLYVSSLEGYLDALNGGTTTLVDHAHNNWAKDIMRVGYDAAVDSGARVWWCYDVTPRDNFSIPEQWDVYRGIAKDHQKERSTVELGLSYDGHAHLSDEEFKNGLKMVKELDLKAITTHHIGGPWPGE